MNLFAEYKGQRGMNGENFGKGRKWAPENFLYLLITSLGIIEYKYIPLILMSFPEEDSRTYLNKKP